MLSNRQLFLRNVAQTSGAPLLLEIQRAEGVYLFDAAGEMYMDLISGISVSSLGHGNKNIISAIEQQSKHYLHLMVYGELIQSPQVGLAGKLAGLLPPNLESVYFVNSGSEAVEGALKLSRRYTGRKKIIAARNAYHGSTYGAMSLMSGDYGQAFGPLLPQVEHIRFNSTADLSAIDTETAAVIIETIQGEAGYMPADRPFMQALKEKCRQNGALLILDEIQCGMGRTGRLFGFEHYGIEPDILLLAKAFGAGMPLGAFIASREIMNCLTHDPVLGHMTTFGGHPVCCAAALAGLNYLLENKIMEEIPKKELLFRQLLQHPKIKNISGKGLMLALEFSSFEENKRYIDRCIKKGLLTDWFLWAENKMRIAPPLIISLQEIEKACEIILESISEG
jgi:acetylornithine/N-succinyldiaminopimelate aminotransferase